jgi:hypothetical protein
MGEALDARFNRYRSGNLKPGMTLATIRHPEVRAPASLEGLLAAAPRPSPFEARVNLFARLSKKLRSFLYRLACLSLRCALASIHGELRGAGARNLLPSCISTLHSGHWPHLLA